MRIEVTRSGGFAGIPRHAVLDTATRPDADHLHALAEAALAPLPTTAPRPTPDGFAYILTVDDRTLECAEPLLTPAQRELIAAVLGEGGRKAVRAGDTVTAFGVRVTVLKVWRMPNPEHDAIDVRTGPA